eukprot:2239861-Rhodomonas_salina.1
MASSRNIKIVVIVGLEVLRGAKSRHDYFEKFHSESTLFLDDLGRESRNAVSLSRPNPGLRDGWYYYQYSY